MSITQDVATATATLAELLESSQPSVEVRVEAYNAEHLAALRKLSSAVPVDALCGRTVEIPLSEILTYGMFRMRQNGVAGWSTYADLQEKRDYVAGGYRLGLLRLNGRSICAGRVGNEQPPEVTQAMGEGIGLSVMNRLHRLTEADWSKVLIGQVKDFDFSVASDGRQIIEVENKGACVENNGFKAASVSAHAADIRAKKAAQPKRRRVRYGTIAAVDPRPDSVARLWLLDPIPESPETDPLRYKLLSRLHYAAHLLSTISPRSPYAAALYTRIGAIELVKDYASLDSARLRRSSGEPVTFSRNGEHLEWFLGRSMVQDLDAGGTIFPWDENGVLFFGMMGGVLDLAASQAFEGILAFEEAPRSELHTVACVAPRARFNELRVPKELRDRKAPQARFDLRGILHLTSGGRVFGYLRYTSLVKTAAFF